MRMQSEIGQQGLKAGDVENHLRCIAKYQLEIAEQVHRHGSVDLCKRARDNVFFCCCAI